MQIWVADQVGALVTAATQGEVFNPLVMKAALSSIVRSNWGSLSAAGRYLKIEESLFRWKFRPGTLVDLQLLLALCSSSGASILDVLRGSTDVEPTVGQTYAIQPRWSIKRKTKGVSEEKIERLISSDPSLTLKELAARLDVSDVWFREHFPRQASEMAEKYRVRRSKSGWRRLLAVGRVMREAAIYLEQIGLTFNKDNIERYFGLSIWWHKDEVLYERFRAKLRSKHLDAVRR
ncbi:hypothetical protein ATN79_22055 [Paraburkholderia caribensis]|nr:hypothetical protein ATN79_22055 [Paraburkholderia caribensis]